jgi:alpha-tubulin suppressor-like RCC1 family protein
VGSGSPPKAYSCAASPVRMSTIRFAQTFSAKYGAGQIGPYGLAEDGRLYRIEEAGPVLLAGGMAFKTVSGGSPVCGVAPDGRGLCWGNNAEGLMGIGTASFHGPWPDTPTEVSGGVRWTQLVRGTAICGVAESGVVYCWGPNGDFSAGVGTSTLGPGCIAACVLVPTPVKTTARFTQLAGGRFEVCGLATDAAVYCWGWGRTDAGGPYRVTTSLQPFVTLSGNFNICGLDAAQAAYCLPAASPVNEFVFSKVPLPFPVKKIVIGDKVSCALSAADGRLYCWGAGVLGTGQSNATATVSNPAEVWGQRPPI